MRTVIFKASKATTKGALTVTVTQSVRNGRESFTVTVTHEESATVEDLTYDSAKAIEFANLALENELEPLQLCEVAEDFIVE